MAGSRSEKSTIPPEKDPLANVTYRQPAPTPPINGLIVDTTKEAKPEPEPVKKPRLGPRPPKPGPEPEPPKSKVTVTVPDDLLERLRNAAWWKRTTLAALAEEGIQQVLAKLERENGGPFEAREEQLRPGRPQGAKSRSAKAN